MEEKKTQAAQLLQSLMGSGNMGIMGDGNVGIVGNVVHVTVIAAGPNAGDAADAPPDVPDAPVPELHELMALYKRLQPKEREGVQAFMRREFQTGRIDSLSADARQRLMRYLKACLRNRSGAKTNSKGKT